MGARVIKIEQPGRGDDTRGWGPPFVRVRERVLSQHQPQQGEPDARSEAAGGAAEFSSACSTAPTCWSRTSGPGTMERLGFGYEQLSPRWPRIVYCSISGFGQTGPRRDQPGYDAVVQAEGGLMSITGDRGRPALPPWRRDRRHRQRHVRGAGHRAGAARARTDAAAGSSSTSACSTRPRRSSPIRPAIYFATGRAPERLGNRHPTIVPYETFDAADGEFVLAVGNDDQWRRFCTVAGLTRSGRAMSDSRPTALRVEHYDALQADPRRAAARREPRAEWIVALNAEGVPCGAVRDIARGAQGPAARRARA